MKKMSSPHTRIVFDISVTPNFSRMISSSMDRQVRFFFVLIPHSKVNDSHTSPCLLTVLLGRHLGPSFSKTAGENPRTGRLRLLP